MAKPLGPRASELAAEQQPLRPRHQVVGDEDELEPDLVHREVTEGELRQAGVLAVGDLVLGPGASAVATLQGGEVGAPLVGEDRLEAVAVVVGEGELGAGVWALATDDYP